ncbi:glycosyltransferase [Aeromonas caviae]|uniref:glycosyltransferase n=1 Tax=Aeromonas caviae TaxID=648 RepID=UPI003F7447AE
MISIITVVYKDYVGLERTIESLVSQSASKDDFEYIVVDGDSNCSKINSLTGNKIVSNFISEPDSGIYDAMNKGVLLSKGDWIIFMNAGDTFSDGNVLKKIIDNVNRHKDGFNFLWGKYCADGQVFAQECSLSFLISHMLNHQSIIYHRSLFTVNYDLRYRFCADYAHLLSIWPQLRPQSLDFCIANFDTTGVSSQTSNKARMWQERLLAVWRSNLNFFQKIILSSRGFIAWPYHFMKIKFHKVR